MATNKILGSITKVFDPAPPANVKELMLRTPSGTQRERAEELIQQFRVAKARRDDWTVPTKRCLVIFAREKIKTFDDVADLPRRRFLEKAGIEHAPKEVLTFDQYLEHDMAGIATAAGTLIIELNRGLCGHIEKEITKAIAFLRPLYATHNCEHAIDDSEPIRMLNRALELAEVAASGQVFIGPWQSEHFLAEWLE